MASFTIDGLYKAGCIYLQTHTYIYVYNLHKKSKNKIKTVQSFYKTVYIFFSC